MLRKIDYNSSFSLPVLNFPAVTKQLFGKMLRFCLSYDMFYRRYKEHTTTRGCIYMQLPGERQQQNSVDVTLYDRYASTIFAYLARRLPSLQDAEDILLDVFIAALNHDNLTGLTTEQQLVWLLRVAHNKIVDRYRHLTHLTLVPLEQSMEFIDDALTPEQMAERKEAYERLYSSLALLSPIQQQLIQLRFGKSLPFAEIADILRQTEGSVRKLLVRTLRHLRAIYEEKERSL